MSEQGQMVEGHAVAEKALNRFIALNGEHQENVMHVFLLAALATNPIPAGQLLEQCITQYLIVTGGEKK